MCFDFKTWQMRSHVVHCEKYRNFTKFSGVEILLKGTVFTIAYSSTWLRNTIIIFVIWQICWKQGQVDLTVHNTGMLIRFSKQIANSFAKTINGWKFLEVIRGEFKILPKI